MKKLMILFMFCLVIPVIAGTGTGRTAEIDLVFDKNVRLDTIRGTGGNGDTLLFSSDIINIWCDTLSFILEVTSDSTSAITNNPSASFTVDFSQAPLVTKVYGTDQIIADLKLQCVSPSGYTCDSSTFNGLIAVLNKGKEGGNVIFGGKLSIPESVTKGKLWLKINHGYNTVQHARVRIYRVRKWAD